MATNDNDDLRVFFSLLASANDNKPDVREFRWGAITNLLSRCDVREEKNGPAFCPAKFIDKEYTSQKTGEKYTGIYRRVQAVEHVSLAVADYDDGTPLQVARAVWSDYENVIYTSHSSTNAHNKFRVVLPLAEPILTGNWRDAWLHFKDMATNGFNDQLLQNVAQSCPGEGRIDRSCKDPSRLYYLPSSPPGGDSDYYHNRGELLSLPITTHPSVTLRPAQKWMKNPVSNPTGAMPTLTEFLDKAGVQYKFKKDGIHGLVHQLYQCPWGSSHTDGKDKLGDAAVFENGGRWCFSCCHDGCQDRGWKDFRAQVAPKKPSFKPTWGKKK
jgi:hypothetical protein